MTTSQAPTPQLGSLVRLTITGNGRRLDIGVPSAVPAAELIPEFARNLGMLDAETVYGGYRLLRHDGVLVDTDRGLQSQGVEDGFVLSLEAGASEVPAKVYDDVIEAVADLVETQYAPWTPRDSSLTALAASVALLLAGAVGLLADLHDTATVVSIAGATAVLLLMAAAVIGRTRDDDVAAVVVVLSASGYAAVAGLAAVQNYDLWGRPLAAAGVAAAVTALLGILAVPRRRELLGIPLLSGTVLAACGLIVGFGNADTGAVFPIAFAITVALGNAIPWTALSSTRLRVQSPRSDSEIYADQAEIEEAAVREQVRRGHGMLAALGAAVGVIALACTPHVVQTGIAGTGLAAVGFATIMLRTRNSRTRATVLIAMISSVVGLAETGIAAIVLHESWRAPMSIVLAALAAFVLAVTTIAPKPRVRLGRIADALELACMVALLPVAVVVAGIIGAVRH